MGVSAKRAAYTRGEWYAPKDNRTRPNHLRDLWEVGVKLKGPLIHKMRGVVYKTIEQCIII